MATVNKVKNGIFIVQWQPKEKFPEEPGCDVKKSETIITVPIENRKAAYSLQYTCILGKLQVQFTLRNAEDCPEKVTGIIGGIENTLEESSPRKWKGAWGSGKIDAPCYCGKKPNLAIILYYHNTGEEHILNSVSNLFCQKMEDVHFTVQNEKIGAHKAILASSSPVLEAMFQGEDSSNEHSSSITITGVTPKVFKQMLQFLYTGKVPSGLKSTLMLEALFSVAVKYGIQSLKNACEIRLAQSVTKDKAVRFLVMAHVHLAPKLLEASLKCIGVHRAVIWDTQEWKDTMTKYPDLFFQASRRMALKRPFEDDD